MIYDPGEDLRTDDRTVCASKVGGRPDSMVVNGSQRLRAPISPRS